MYSIRTCIYVMGKQWMEDKAYVDYRTAGYFRGVYILQSLKLLQFTEFIFTKIMENHIHVPSVVTFAGAIFVEIFISQTSRNIHPSKITRYTVYIAKMPRTKLQTRNLGCANACTVLLRRLGLQQSLPAAVRDLKYNNSSTS